MGEPYDWDAYAEEFVPEARLLERAASKAESVGEIAKAAEFFLFVALLHDTIFHQLNYTAVAAHQLYTASLASQLLDPKSNSPHGHSASELSSTANPSSRIQSAKSTYLTPTVCLTRANISTFSTYSHPTLVP